MKEKSFTWRKLLLLAIVIIIIFFVITLRILPRRSWSLKGQGRTGHTLKDVHRTDSKAEDIRGVVLISIDTCRADHLSCYGYSHKTSPNIDSVASDGILFNHAITPVPLTLPSHSSMLTGTIPPFHKVHDNINYRLGDSNITLAEILRENGFQTGAVIGSFVLNSRFGLAQGFDDYDDYLRDKASQEISYNARRADEVTRLAND